MAIDADNLPREGFNTQHFIENMSERVGSNNIIDVIISNPMRVARQVGARPPAYHPSHAELNMVKPRMVESPNAILQPPQPPQNTQPSNIPPKIEDMPDTPRGLHTPKARMMPGADTEPGKPISEKDAEAFNKAITEMNVRQGNAVRQICRNTWDNIPSQYGSPKVNYSPHQNSVVQKPVFFKDGLGNEYKMMGDSLYVLGWQDANVKVRLVSETTGKEVPTNGKKFQIYGWHLVQKMDETETTKADDVTRIENEIRTDDNTNKDASLKKENRVSLSVTRAPMIAKENVAVVESNVEDTKVIQDTASANNEKTDAEDVASTQIHNLIDSTNQQVLKSDASENKAVATTDKNVNKNTDESDKKKKLSKRRLI